MNLCFNLQLPIYVNILIIENHIILLDILLNLKSVALNINLECSFSICKLFSTCKPF